MKSLLASATLEKPIPDQLAQIAFLKVWPDP
jgi:hypothetical protein